MNQPTKYHDGFTLIELMLAMTFISFLLLAIALVTIQMSNIYNKGMTLQSVNQAGRTLSDSLQRDIAASKPFALDSKAHYQTTTNGGLLCLGDVSYVWNYGKTLSRNDYSTMITYTDSTPTRIDTPVRMVRIPDASGQYCTDPAMLHKVDKAKSTELLSGVDAVDIAIQGFNITMPGPTGTGALQPLYTISVVIGTNDQAAINTVNATCAPPASDKSNWQFCAINVFNFTARAGSKG